MQVYTTKGVVDRSLLTVKDIITEEDNARITATEWFMGDELVRRDVNVNILVGQALDGEQGAI
jgi:phage FluMu protein gp41